MRIANPLYDHALKYLMSNEHIAKLVLSTILNQEVVGVDVSLQEVVVPDNKRNFTAISYKFVACLKNNEPNWNNS